MKLFAIVIALISIASSIAITIRATSDDIPFISMISWWLTGFILGGVHTIINMD